MKPFAVLLAFVVSTIASPFVTAAPPPNEAPPPSVPPGWSVAGVPRDPQLSKASVSQLIDQLQQATPDLGPHASINSFWPIGGCPNLGTAGAYVLFTSPAAIELVRRGVDALPQLLDHLTDARRTRLIYAVAETEPATKESPAFGDDYDPRGADKTTGLSAVNTGVRTPLNEDGTYTFKVGDLCFVIVGQIVGRDLYVVHCRGEDAAFRTGWWPSSPGMIFQTIDSPVARPALADATRAEWHALTTAEHEQLLRDALHRPPARRPRGFNASTPNFQILSRLLYYHPTVGAEIAEHLLRRKIVDPKAAPSEDTTTFWLQAQLVRELGPFRCDQLRVSLRDLFHEATAAADADLQARTSGQWEAGVPSLGSDVALACAEQLIHTGHDEEFAAYFKRRIAMIEQRNQGVSSPSLDLGTARFVNSIQVQKCKKFVAELEEESAAAAGDDHKISQPSAEPPPKGEVRLGAVTAVRNKRGYHDLELGFELLDPAPWRVLVARVMITHAIDEVGVVLLPTRSPQFSYTAVGMTSEAELTGFPKPNFAAGLSTAAPKAKSFQVEGRVELIVPDVDPDAVVVVDNIAAQFGHPLASAALQKAGLAITLVAGTGTAKLARLTEPPPVNMAELLESNHSASALTKRIDGMRLGDVALEITDPNERLIRVEFQDAGGRSLRYNHHGWYHTSGVGRARVDVYRLGTEIPPDTRMVCWLVTPKALFVAPFKLSAVPIQSEL